MKRYRVDARHVTVFVRRIHNFWRTAPSLNLGIGSAIMSDFRVERARILLSEPIEGLDPNANIDPEELCWIDPTGIDTNTCGARPLTDFYVARFAGWEEDKWFPAQEGLTTVRKLLKYYGRILQDGVDPMRRQMSVIEENFKLLQQVELVLAAAHESEIWFCLAVSD